MKQKTNEGDERKNPYRSADERLGKFLTLLSRGEKIERSHKKRVGNIVNKNIDNRYLATSSFEKTMKRINKNYNMEN